MNLKINKLEEVWTADKVRLGLADRVFHRNEGVNPDLELYEAYLVIENFDLGSNFYVPVDFISDHDEETRGIKLTVTFAEVLKNTWSRMPHFIALGDARREELSEVGASDRESVKIIKPS